MAMVSFLSFWVQYTMEDFLNAVQASEAEIAAGLQRLKALELKGEQPDDQICMAADGQV